MPKFSTESVMDSLEMRNFRVSDRGRFLVADTISSTLNDGIAELGLSSLGVQLMKKDLERANAEFIGASGGIVTMPDGTEQWVISYNPTYIEQAMIQSVRPISGRVVLVYVRHTTAHEVYHPYQRMIDPERFERERKLASNLDNLEAYHRSWLEREADLYGFNYGRTRESTWIRKLANLDNQRRLFIQE